MKCWLRVLVCLLISSVVITWFVYTKDNHVWNDIVRSFPGTSSNWSRDVMEVASDQSDNVRFFPGTNSILSRGAKKTSSKKSYTKVKMTKSLKSGSSDVMIMAYMRSGSSFMGRVLGRRRDTFYWYEPFHATHINTFIARNGDVCNIEKDMCRNVSDKSIESLSRSKRFIMDLYNCQHLDQHVRKRFKELASIMSYSRGTNHSFKDCATSNKTCYPVVNRACHMATHRVTKVLRLATAHARYFLENLPRYKLVQIFRDPRGMLNSKRNTFNGSRKHSDEKEAEMLCKRMEMDVDSALQLRKEYPGRVQILQYEDFADPLALANHLYPFLNMKMTRFERKYLKFKSMGDEFTPSKFRTAGNWSMVDAINKHCRKIFNRLGYRVFETIEELEDMNVSSVIGELPFKLPS